MLNYKGYQDVSICGDTILTQDGKVIARATTWQDGPNGILVAVDSDNEAGKFIAKNTNGAWDGTYVHSSGCVCDWCKEEKKEQFICPYCGYTCPYSELGGEYDCPWCGDN